MPAPVDVLIVESTHGPNNHEERAAREQRMLKAIEKTLVKNQGKVLLPVVGLGRVQELMLFLEDHWARHPELQKYPIFYSSAQATRAARIYETFQHSCGPGAQRGFGERSPWELQYVENVDVENDVSSADAAAAANNHNVNGGGVYNDALNQRPKASKKKMSRQQQEAAVVARCA